MNISEIYHSFFSTLEETFPLEESHTIKVRPEGSLKYSAEITLEWSPEVPKEAVIVGYAGSDDYGISVVRYPDNTYHIAAYHPDTYTSDDKYIKIFPVEVEDQSLEILEGMKEVVKLQTP